MLKSEQPTHANVLLQLYEDQIGPVAAKVFFPPPIFRCRQIRAGYIVVEQMSIRILAVFVAIPEQNLSESAACGADGIPRSSLVLASVQDDAIGSRKADRTDESSVNSKAGFIDKIVPALICFRCSSCDYYVFATNLSLSPVSKRGGKDRLRSVLDGYKESHGLKDYAIWDGDQIGRFLDAHPGIRTT